MFPTQKVSLSSPTPETNSSGENTFYFDFNEGDFVLNETGNATELSNIEAVKMWVRKIIKTDQYMYEIYGDYGVSFNDLITGEYPQSYVVSEIERILIETLSTHPAILNVYNFSFTRERRILKVNFNIDTIYGSTSEVITI